MTLKVSILQLSFDQPHNIYTDFCFAGFHGQQMDSKKYKNIYLIRNTQPRTDQLK